METITFTVSAGQVRLLAASCCCAGEQLSYSPWQQGRLGDTHLPIEINTRPKQRAAALDMVAFALRNTVRGMFAYQALVTLKLLKLLECSIQFSLEHDGSAGSLLTCPPEV